MAPVSGGRGWETLPGLLERCDAPARSIEPRWYEWTHVVGRGRREPDVADDDGRSDREGRPGAAGGEGLRRHLGGGHRGRRLDISAHVLPLLRLEEQTGRASCRE